MKQKGRQEGSVINQSEEEDGLKESACREIMDEYKERCMRTFRDKAPSAIKQGKW